MNFLEIDAGNTRIKWRIVDSVNQGSMSAIAVSENSGEMLDSALGSMLSTGQLIESVRVSSVRGEEFDRYLVSYFERLHSVGVSFARTSAQCAGVKNSYEDVSLMGVDRWLAMLAAFQKAQQEGGRGCCVVDYGSALTVDVVNSMGQHLGGYILPGLSLMLKSLKDRSKALNVAEAAEWKSIGLGRATNIAMENGILAMHLSLLERLHREYPKLEWFLCGGDASVVLPLLKWKCHHIETLVLDGISLTQESRAV